MAWAPPILKNLVTPTKFAAYKIAGWILGEQIITS